MMTPAERARAWFRRWAKERLVDGQVVAYGVDWSDEVEASLTAAFAESLLPDHEPWGTRTQYVMPKRSEDHEGP